MSTTPEEVWHHIERWSFAVVGFVTPTCHAHASGVMYTVCEQKLYVLTGRETYKARCIRDNPNVAVTISVPRIPFTSRKIPPAAITFPGLAVVLDIDRVNPELRRRLLRGVGDDLGDICSIAIEPVGRFITYGIGIPAFQMRHPDRALARVTIR